MAGEALNEETNTGASCLFRNKITTFAILTVSFIDFVAGARYDDAVLVVDRTIRLTDELLYAAVGRRVRKARLEKKITQEELAAAIGLTRTSITNIEKGRQKLLLHTLSALARRLAVPCASLLPDESELESGASQSPEYIVDKAGTRDEKERQFVLRTLSQEKKGR